MILQTDFPAATLTGAVKPPLPWSDHLALLHFAATNGHTNVVRTGVLMRENGMEGMAEMLTEWLVNMDRDLSMSGRLGWILPICLC